MLLEVFWRSVDPTDGGGQFCDRGVSYETAVFVTSLDQRRSAEASKKALMSSGALKKTIVTKIEDAGKLYPAKDYHQDYYKNIRCVTTSAVTIVAATNAWRSCGATRLTRASSNTRIFQARVIKKVMSRPHFV